jgi:hypothetical protein
VTCFAIFAFYGVPVVVFAVACGAVVLHERLSLGRTKSEAASRQGRLHLTA